MAFALDALADPDAKVLAHCHMGINRGPAMAFAILLTLGWVPVAAMDAIRGARSIAAVAARNPASLHARRLTARTIVRRIVHQGADYAWLHD